MSSRLTYSSLPGGIYFDCSHAADGYIELKVRLLCDSRTRSSPCSQNQPISFGRIFFQHGTSSMLLPFRPSTYIVSSQSAYGQNYRHTTIQGASSDAYSPEHSSLQYNATKSDTVWCPNKIPPSTRRRSSWPSSYVTIISRNDDTHSNTVT